MMVALLLDTIRIRAVMYFEISSNGNESVNAFGSDIFIRSVHYEAIHVGFYAMFNV